MLEKEPLQIEDFPLFSCMWRSPAGSSGPGSCPRWTPSTGWCPVGASDLEILSFANLLTSDIMCLSFWCNIFKLVCGRLSVLPAACLSLAVRTCLNVKISSSVFLSRYFSHHFNKCLPIRILTHKNDHLNILQATNLNSAFHSSLCLSCSSALKPWEQSSELVVQNRLMFRIGCSELVDV